MKRRLFDILACPICGEDFSAKIGKEIRTHPFRPRSRPCYRRCYYKEEIGEERIPDQTASLEACAECYGREILEGTVSCRLGHTFSISRGVLRALSFEQGETGPGEKEREFRQTLNEHKKVKATFDQEWKMVDAGHEIYGHSPDQEEKDFLRRMCVEQDYLRAKLALDVGCGIGRLANTLSHKGAEIVGVELSNGVDLAWEMSLGNPTVHFIQGNLYTLPLQPRAFDYVYCKGVLQYVANPREAFHRISRHVRVGGGVSITLYPPLPPWFSVINQRIRAFTLRLPLQLVQCISLMAVPLLSPAWKISKVEKRPISWKDRGHMIFNWLASDHQNFHSTEEVVSWYLEEGFGEVRFSPLPVGVFGRWEGYEK